ncbi:MAG: crossover junction endodeoxyribonuclease RuvC [Crenarchaeota archaeon]|nr:crossover junction endodeoxyribonuclease RuvC [Thermoproteota archaeon]
MSGWSVLNDDMLIDYGLINANKKPEPLYFFRTEIIKLITNYKPNIIVWEDLKSMRNLKTVRRLSEFTGNLREICEEYKISYLEAFTGSVRAKVCTQKGSGNRGAKTKEDVANVIVNKYELEIPETKKDKEIFFNISDSIAMGLYCYMSRSLNNE